GRERRENAIAIELTGRAGVAMSDGDVASMPRLDAQRDADDFGVHRIEARRLGIERRELRRLNCCQPSRKRLLVVDDFVARFKWRRRARIRRFVRIATPPISLACARTFSSVPYCASHFAAVFGPTFGTPGMLSMLSPVNVSRSRI